MGLLKQDAPLGACKWKTAMRKLTEQDMFNIAGSTIQGFYVEYIKIKGSKFTENNQYGIILGKNIENCYVTWQFHINENEEVIVYSERYFKEDKEAALQDFYNRDVFGASRGE